MMRGKEVHSNLNWISHGYPSTSSSASCMKNQGQILSPILLKVQTYSKIFTLVFVCLYKWTSSIKWKVSILSHFRGILPNVHIISSIMHEKQGSNLEPYPSESSNSFTSIYISVCLFAWVDVFHKKESKYPIPFWGNFA